MKPRREQIISKLCLLSPGNALREKIIVKKDAPTAEIEALALALPKVIEHLAGKTVKKIVVVPGRLVNIVVG